MTFAAFPTNEKAASELGARYVVAEVFGIPLEPAPYTAEEGGVFDMFAGTIKYVHSFIHLPYRALLIPVYSYRAVLPGPNGEERTVSPYSSTGNTGAFCCFRLAKWSFATLRLL